MDPRREMHKTFVKDCKGLIISGSEDKIQTMERQYIRKEGILLR